MDRRLVMELDSPDLRWDDVIDRDEFLKMISRYKIKIGRTDKRHKVFDMLSKETQDKFLEYWNKDWYCGGSMFSSWPPDPGIAECMNCCCQCELHHHPPGLATEDCGQTKCGRWSPMIEMCNCEHWISLGEIIALLRDEKVPWRERRKQEYVDMFRGFHIYEEMVRDNYTEVIDEDLRG